MKKMSESSQFVWCKVLIVHSSSPVADNVSIRKQNLVWYPDNINYCGMCV